MSDWDYGYEERIAHLRTALEMAGEELTTLRARIGITEPIRSIPGVLSRDTERAVAQDRAPENLATRLGRFLLEVAPQAWSLIVYPPAPGPADGFVASLTFAHGRADQVNGNGPDLVAAVAALLDEAGA